MSTFIQRFGNVLDFGADTDNDGIPDDLEDDLILYNGKTISTDYELADTDEDGLKDGEEVRLEVKYSPDGNYATVVGHLISDPTEMDSEGDGISDNEDTAPLTKGLAGGIIGEMTIVSYHDDSDSFFSGHSFLLYKSKINDKFDFYNFYGVYSSRLGELDNEEYNSLYRIYREDNLRNYQIYKNEYITFDVAADGIGNSGSNGNSSGSGSSGDSMFNFYALRDNLEGGSWIDWEFNIVYYASGKYAPNASYSLPITESQLNTIINCYSSCKGYSIYSSNCALYAAKAWNEAFDDSFESKDGAFHTPQKLKESIKDRHLACGRDVPQIDINDILKEMRFNIE